MSALQVGGAVRAGAPYVQRPADRILPEALLAGELCYVLAPRQIGKSSLRIRAAASLRAAGLRVASIDLSGFGAAGLDPETWFYGLAVEAALSLGLPDPAAGWEEAAGRPPAARWAHALARGVVHAEGPPAVILLDEIDAVLALPFGGEDLFAAIRAAHDRRAEDPAWARLRFGLLGVASPADLIQDPRRTPFNVGRAVRLADFTPEEARALLPALEGLGAEPEALLDAVMRWSAGHPFQTAQLCAALAEEPGSAEEVERRVQGCVRRLYLGAWSDPGLEAAGRLLCDPAHPELLGLYRRALGPQGLPWDPRSASQRRLGLSGVVALRGDRVQVRNEIVRLVYNQEWISAVQGRRALRERAWAWMEAGRPEHLLLDERGLGELQRQSAGVELDREEEAYLLRSEAHLAARRARARTRGLQRVALSLGLLLALVAVLAWGERRHAALQTLARKVADIPPRAAIPGRQDEALHAALDALAALRGTPFEALASRGLAGTLEAVRGRPLGQGVAWTVAWLDDGALLAGREDGRLEYVASGGVPLGLTTLGSGLSALAISPDGARALLGAADGSVRWWDLRASAPLGEAVLAHVPGPSRRCLHRWVSDRAPGVRLARVGATGLGLTVGAEGGLRIWDPGGGSRIVPVEDALDAQFSPDGARIAVATGRGLLLLVDARSGEALETRGPWEGAPAGPEECEGVREHPDALVALAVSPSGALAAVGRRGVSVLTSWEPGAPARALEPAGAAAPWAVALSQDGEVMAVAAETGVISVWGSRAGALRLRHAEPRQGALALSFSPDGRWLAATGHDDRVYLWDVRGGDLLWQAAAMVGGGVSLAFSPDSRRLAVAGGGGLRLFDAAPSVALDRWEHPGRGRPSSLSVSPLGEVLVSWTDGPPSLLLPGGLQASDQPLPAEPVDTAHFSPDGARVLWSGERGARVALRRARPGALLEGRAIFWLDPWSGDGGRLALWHEGQGRVYAVGGELMAKLADPVRPELKLSPDGARVLGVTPDGGLRLFDARTGARLASPCELGKERLYPLSWAPDGRRFAAGGSDRVCLAGYSGATGRTIPLQEDGRHLAWAGERLWALDNGDTLLGLGADGRIEVEAAAHPSQARMLRASPEGRRLVSAADDGDVHLWSEEGESLARWQVHLGVARQVAFSPDGGSIYSAGDDGAVVRLPGSTEALVAMACAWLTETAPRPAVCAD